MNENKFDLDYYVYHSNHDYQSCVIRMSFLKFHDLFFHLTGLKKVSPICSFLPICILVYLRDAVLMFICMKGLAPEYFLSIFALRSEIHDRSSPNSDMLQIPKCRTKLIQQCITYRAVDIWNYYADKLGHALNSCLMTEYMVGRLVPLIRF